MTEDECIRVVGLQTGEYRLEGKFLCRGAGVVITTILIQTTLVADADAVGVVVSGMGAGHFLTPTGVDVSVAGDVVVVADTVIATCSVARIEVLYCETRVAARGTAVNYYQVDSSHICTVLKCLLVRSGSCSFA